MKLEDPPQGGSLVGFLKVFQFRFSHSLRQSFTIKIYQKCIKILFTIAKGGEELLTLEAKATTAVHDVSLASQKGEYQEVFRIVGIFIE